VQGYVLARLLQAAKMHKYFVLDMPRTVNDRHCPGPSSKSFVLREGMSVID
jgi:hypothetical protein